MATDWGNSLAMIVKLAVMKAEAPRAVMVRRMKHSTMKMVPGGHRYVILDNREGSAHVDPTCSPT